MPVCGWPWKQHRAEEAGRQRGKKLATTLSTSETNSSNWASTLSGCASELRRAGSRSKVSRRSIPSRRLVRTDSRSASFTGFRCRPPTQIFRSASLDCSGMPWNCLRRSAYKLHLSAAGVTSGKANGPRSDGQVQPSLAHGHAGRGEEGVTVGLELRPMFGHQVLVSGSAAWV